MTWRAVLGSLVPGASVSMAALGIAPNMQACGAEAQTSGRRVALTSGSSAKLARPPLALGQGLAQLSAHGFFLGR